jgi:hypothetical protein
MGLFGKLFKEDDKPTVVDLTKPYRALLEQQTSPVVRGVLLHAITSLDELRTPNEIALLGNSYVEAMKKRMSAAHKLQSTYTPADIAMSAMVQAATYIMINSAGNNFYGEDMIIRNQPDPENLKKAAICYTFGLLIFTALLTYFIQAGLLSSGDKQLSDGTWRADLLACFMVASQEQKAEIDRHGTKMFFDMQERPESNVKEFLETFEQLTMLTAMNWEGKKAPEDQMMGLFKQKADVLLGALT